MTASIVGWAHTPFGKLENETVESLVVRVATEAMADAGISAADVDEIVLGHFNAGFSPQDFTASLVLQADPALRFKPATRVENACATGSAAVQAGVKSIAAGTAKIVLVVGVEQMTRTPGPEVGKNLLRASYLPEDGDTPAGFAGVFGGIAQKYFQKYGDQSDALAMIAAKNHANGMHNPYAHMRKDFGFEFCRSESDKNPFVAGPLKRSDCSLVSDGAAALVLTDSETAKAMGKAVTIKSTAHAQDFLPMSKRRPRHRAVPRRVRARSRRKEDASARARMVDVRIDRRDSRTHHQKRARLNPMGDRQICRRNGLSERAPSSVPSRQPLSARRRPPSVRCFYRDGPPTSPPRK